MSACRIFAASMRRVAGWKAMIPLVVLVVFGTLVDTAQAAARISVLEGDSCTIAADGRVQCWGDRAADAGAGAGRAMDMPGFPADVIGLAGSTPALCALTGSGALWCQGFYPGNGVSYAETPVAPAGMGSDVVDVARGSSHVCVAKTDGSVWCWGYNYYGLGDGSTTNSNVPIQALPPSFGAAGVAAGGDHVCAWSQAGEARCWGYNYYGQLGHGVTGGSEAAPVAVAGLTGVQHMAASLSHTCALVEDGRMYCWGNNDYSQLGDGTYTNSPVPVLAGNFVGIQIIAVFAGNAFTCAQFHTGQLACNGANYYRQTAASGVLYPDLREVALGIDHACALVDGRAHCWGRNDYGEAGNGRFGNEYAPVKLLNGGFAQAPSTAHAMGCATDQGGSVTCWGGSFSMPPYAHASVSGIGGSASAVGNGWGHQCVLRDDGVVSCWGNNWYGMLGDGTTDFRNSPAPVAGISQEVSRISVGVYHNCAVLADASVVCWGSNFNGEAGGADFQDRLTPGPVAGLSGVAHVSAGYLASCAVDGAGQVWCWGSSQYGLLGPATTADTASPVQIQGLPALAQRVSVGYMHACALLQDGRIACWGYGGYGQLGQGEFTYAPTLPVLVASDETFVQVVTGKSHTCARNDTDDVFCWGQAWRGQLGVVAGTRGMSHAAPQEVALKAIDLAAVPSADATCALDAQADAWCWGGNENAQLGIGRRGVREVPGPVMGAGEDVFSDGFEP